MAAKRSLDDMLSAGTSKPVIRRGQGIRLSTDAAQEEAAAAEATAAAELESAQAHKRTNAPDRDEAARVTRVSQGQRLRVDLVKELKRIAVEEDRKLYEVMEEALEQYIERRKGDGM
ncbi:MAG TPA: hypothetical protein VLA19_01615 [Herpetosiphonaceae bacterium]|nr:hypothetical protein [Herpetosiphonaceae bacterium]